MSKLNTLTNGHIVEGKLGVLTDCNKQGVDWKYEGKIELYIEKHKGEIITLVPTNVDIDIEWAEYSLIHFDKDDNSFENEGYYMVITDWNI